MAEASAYKRHQDRMEAKEIEPAPRVRIGVGVKLFYGIGSVAFGVESVALG